MRVERAYRGQVSAEGQSEENIWGTASGRNRAGKAAQLNWSSFLEAAMMVTLVCFAFSVYCHGLSHLVLLV